MKLNGMLNGKEASILLKNIDKIVEAASVAKKFQPDLKKYGDLESK